MLKDKIILITGSSKSNGIGFATAKLAKEYGATPILHGRSEKAELKKLAKQLDCKYIVCDATNKQEVDEAVSKFSRIDVLVNCAGFTIRTNFMESSNNEWLDVYKINVLGTVNFCQAVIPKMQKQKHGRIVNISSIRGYGITSGRPAYSAAKAAIMNLTSVLAKEYAPNIYVNAVSPGFTETDMSKTWDEAVWKQVNSSLMRRVGQPREISEAILFLASDKASFITGQTLLVDGGYSLSGK